MLQLWGKKENVAQHLQEDTPTLSQPFCWDMQLPESLVFCQISGPQDFLFPNPTTTEREV